MATRARCCSSLWTGYVSNSPGNRRPRCQWGWKSAITDDPGELYDAWYAAAGRSRTTWAKLSGQSGLDVIVEDPDPEWSKKRRRILIDLLEEYLKHTGHADLLREAVDGLRGNDPD